MHAFHEAAGLSCANERREEKSVPRSARRTIADKNGSDDSDGTDSDKS